MTNNPDDERTWSFSVTIAVTVAGHQTREAAKAELIDAISHAVEHLPRTEVVGVATLTHGELTCVTLAYVDAESLYLDTDYDFDQQMYVPRPRLHLVKEEQ